MSESDEELLFEDAEEKISEVRPSKCAVDDAAAASPTGTCVDPGGGKETVASAEPSDELASEEPACNSPATASTGTVVIKTSASDEVDSCVTGDESVGDDTKKSGWGWAAGWSSWGSSVLNTAASSVGTFTTQVGEGLYQVLETVESGFLATDDDNTGDVKPAATDTEIAADVIDAETVVSQEMVRHSDVDEMSSSPDATAADQPDTDGAGSGNEAAGPTDGWLAGWKLPVLSDVVNKTSSVMQQTSSVSMKVIGGGIDVLEAIGRRTYDVLAEGEHGLKKTMVKPRPTLSQTLREAKILTESREQEEEALVESRKSNFGAQFDDFQGLVQLEALESLSSTSELKVRRFVEMLPKDASESLKSELMKIRSVFDDVQTDSDNDDVAQHDFHQRVTDYFGRLNLNASVQKLLACQSKVQETTSSLQQSDDKTPKDVQQLAVQSLAEMTACVMEHWHRAGQQMLLVSLPPQSFQSIANELTGICKVFCNEISLQSTAFVRCLTSTSNSETDSSTSELITGVYLESSNAVDYIHNGLSLLLPVLQLAVIKAHPMFTSTND